VSFSRGSFYRQPASSQAQAFLLALIHRAAEKEFSRKPGFRYQPFSETGFRC
jgi:hypothetical protein